MDKRAHALPKIGEAFEGGIYAGSLTNKEGALYALVLLTDAPRKPLKWQAAMDWAKGLDADLPNRVESALLFNLLSEKFERDWHWTNEVLESDASYAWYCGFLDGNVFNFHKSYEGRARAVRKLPIGSFDPLESAQRRATEDIAKLRASAQALIDACDAAAVQA